MGWVYSDGVWTTTNGLPLSSRTPAPSGYNPTIRRAGMQWNLPRPIDQLNAQHSNSVETVKVPLVGGVTVTDATRGELNLTLNGVLVTDTHADQLEWKKLMYEELIYNTSPFTLFTYYTGNYQRFYINCRCRSLKFDHTTRTVRRLPYTLTILVPDGKEYVAGTYIWNDPQGGEGQQAVPAGTTAATGTDTNPTDRVTYNGPLTIQLNDAAGASYIVWEDITGAATVKINSLGDVQYTGLVLSKNDISA